jgi:predicted phosphoribosyltransferase
VALPFRDRYDAGRQLAAKLQHDERSRNAVVLGLPRGGVPVAFEVAEAIGAPLDVFLVRKLGVPGHEELAMGAIATGGLRVLNEDLVREIAIPAAAVDAVEARERQELARRERLYRGDRPSPDLHGKTAILVDDGLATGSTMVAAARAVRQLGPAQVIGAVPVASADVCAAMQRFVDEMICLETPEPFAAVGLWYDDFSPTSDQEVQELLRRADERTSLRTMRQATAADASGQSKRSAA